MALGLAVAVGITSVVAGAQSCYSGCYVCGTNKQEGDGHLNGYNEATCTSGNGCNQCADGLVKDKSVGAEAILGAVRSSSPGTIGAVAAKYGRQLLLNEGRQLLVIRGTGCDPDGLGPVLFLNRDQTTALAKAGVPSLAEFFSRQGEVTKASPSKVQQKRFRSLGTVASSK
jgi:hypothetical protein